MERPTDSVYRLLGLARRAGAVAPGTEAVRRAVRDGEARLIVVASDASSVQLDKIRGTLQDGSIPWVTLGDRNTLGGAVGLAELSALAVTDRSLGDRLAEELNVSFDERSQDAVEA